MAQELDLEERSRAISEPFTEPVPDDDLVKDCQALALVLGTLTGHAPMHDGLPELASCSLEIGRWSVATDNRWLHVAVAGLQASLERGSQATSLHLNILSWRGHPTSLTMSSPPSPCLTRSPKAAARLHTCSSCFEIPDRVSKRRSPTAGSSQQPSQRRVSTGCQKTGCMGLTMVHAHASAFGQVSQYFLQYPRQIQPGACAANIVIPLLLVNDYRASSSPWSACRLATQAATCSSGSVMPAASTWQGASPVIAPIDSATPFAEALQAVAAFQQKQQPLT